MVGRALRVRALGQHSRAKLLPTTEYKLKLLAGLIRDVVERMAKRGALSLRPTCRSTNKAGACRGLYFCRRSDLREPTSSAARWFG